MHQRKTISASYAVRSARFAREAIVLRIARYATPGSSNLEMVVIANVPTVTGATDRTTFANVRSSNNFNTYLACNEACTKCDGPLSSECSRCAELVQPNDIGKMAKLGYLLVGKEC